MPKPGRLWFGVDVNFFEDHEHLLRPGEMLVFLKILAYAKKKKESSGHVPEKVVRQWLGSKYNRVISALVSVNLVAIDTQTVNQSTFKTVSISAFLDWNMSPAEIAQAREKSRKSSADSRARRASGDKSLTGSPLSIELESKSSETEKEIIYVETEEDGLRKKAREVYDHWRDVMSFPTRKFAGERVTKTEARLREGYSVSQLKAAVDGCRLSEYHMGENDQRKKYNDLDLICRSAVKVDGFIERAEGPAGSVSTKTKIDENGNLPPNAGW